MNMIIKKCVKADRQNYVGDLSTQEIPHENSFKELYHCTFRGCHLPVTGGFGPRLRRLSPSRDRSIQERDFKAILRLDLVALLLDLPVEVRQVALPESLLPRAEIVHKIEQMRSHCLVENIT